MVPGARACGSAITIFSLATRRAPARSYLILPIHQDVFKDAATISVLVSASEGAPISLHLIAALPAPTVLFET